MNGNEYQKMASRTCLSQPDFLIQLNEIMLSWNALGLAGEAGEVCDLIKKGIYHQQGIDITKLKKELGDVLWYLSAICTHLGIELDDVMQLNIDKLKERFPEGWDSERSIYREGKLQ